MTENAIFHHIGVASKSISETSIYYISAGYEMTETVFDPIQNVNISFMKRADSPLLELVEPVDKTSPVHNILKKSGVTPYHFCYEVPKLDIAISELERKDFKLIADPVKAIAFNNRKICFLYNLDVGLIELLEK